jgi:murein DD-endopeptidase MepM/ murein hydrolase activator NlpD
MSKNFYTLLFIPKQKRSARKINISSIHLKAVGILLSVLVLFGAYLFYDYTQMKTDNAELAKLRRQTREQTKEIEGLAAKINEFAVQIEDLKQFDKKIRIMANLEGNRSREQLLGIGGPVSDESFLQTRLDGDRQLLINNMNKNMDKLTADALSQEKSFNALLTYLQEQRSILAAKPSIWPVEGWVTSEFGYRSSPFTQGREFHKGIDIATRINKDILAPADGIVTDVSYRHDEGLMIKINHGYGIATSYGHLLKSAIKQGGIVRRGTVIGFVGNSGRSTGPHLHYTVFVNDVPVNPRRYLN